jgi:predicted nucleic acid-binding protein
MSAAEPGKSFLDTNILVYLFAPDAPEKRVRARQVLERAGAEAELVVSVQVLQEFFVTVTRLASEPLSSEAAEEEVRRLCAFEVVRTDERLVLAGIQRSRTAKISFWDALIVEAALRAGCTTLYTEDLHDGWLVDGRLRVVNPFT